METILAGLNGSVRTWTVTLTVALLAWNVHAVHTLALDESEVYTFIFDLNSSMRVCDAEWVEEHFLPTLIMILQAQGYPETRMSKQEYLKDFKHNCFHRQQSFDSRRMSVSTSRDQAVVVVKGMKGSFFSYFFFEDLRIESVEDTYVIIRDPSDGLLKVQSFQQFLVPAADQPIPLRQ